MQVQFGGCYVNKYIKVADYMNPVDRSIYWFNLIPTPQLAKNLEINFQRISIETEKGWFTSEVESKKYLNIASEVEKMVYLSTVHPEPYIVTFTIKLDRVEKVYLRKYLKMQDLLSYVGGMSKILLLIFHVLLSPIIDYSYLQVLMKSLILKNELVIGKKKSPEAKPQKNRENNQSIKIQKIRKNHLEDLYFVLGISNICKKLNEFEILKKILFDNRNLILFDDICEKKIRKIYTKIDSPSFNSLKEENNDLQLNEGSNNYTRRLSNWHNSCFPKVETNKFKTLPNKEPSEKYNTEVSEKLHIEMTQN